MSKYWNDEEATKKTFDEYGYLRSGDLGQVQFFHIVIKKYNKKKKIVQLDKDGYL